MRASMAAEKGEATTAKEAKHEEPIRVRARDGEEVTLSRDAARLMGTLKDLMDLATSEDGIYPLPTIMASTLQMVCKLNDPDYTWPSSDERSLFQLIQLIEDALYLDAPIALKHIQRAIASRLNGKRAPELCALIGAGGDFGSAEKHAPPNAEPAFVPEDVEAPQQPASSALPPEPLQQPSFSADAMEAALGLVDVATFAELKGVTRSWRTLAQRVLCSRLCRRDGQPVPTRLEEITDLDVEQLIEAGRPGDAAVAGRMLPGLARLHGYGYVVDMAAVRAADLQNGAGNTRRPSLLHGTAKDALSSCISGEGEPPLELTIAAVACAGSGIVCGIPVQQMREDGVTELDLSNRGLQVAAAMLVVAYLIPAMLVVLKNCNLLKNSLDIKSATMLAKIAAEKGIMLSGMTRDQRLAVFTNQNLRHADAIIIASDLKFMAVLTNLELGLNNIGDDGAKAIAEALKVNAALTKLLLGYNNIGVDGAKAIAEVLKVNVVLTILHLDNNNIGAEGAKAIAEALKVNAVVTTLFLGDNNIGVEGAIAIAEALKVNAVVTTLDLGSNSIGVEGAKAIAEALKVTAVVTTLKLGYNSIGVEGAKAIAAAFKVNAAVTEVGLSRNKIGDEGAKSIAEALKVNSVVTTLFLLYNSIGDKGARAIAEALKVNLVVTDLRLWNNNIGNDGAKAIAEALNVNAVLTNLELNVNNIGVEDAKAIAEALKVNAVLTKLKLRNNRIGPEGAIAIAEALKVNAVLTKLDLKYNSNMGDAGKQSMRDAVKDRSGFELEL
jgi:Ran GTPase-activating protein (RanGAP) involved in mRNA processing and transport